VPADDSSFDRALSTFLANQGFERIDGSSDWGRSFDSHAEADGAAEAIEAELAEISENHPSGTKVEIFLA
jgi:hypothetical protein